MDVRDFEFLVSLNMFNSTLMNDAIYKFKRYEDASLEHLGINQHESEDVGLWEITLTVPENIKRLRKRHQRLRDG